MPKRRDRIFVVAAVLFALAFTSLCGLVQRTGSGDAPPVRWKPGRLTVSERAYCVNRFERVADTWRQLGRDAPNEVYLVIDTPGRSAWVEHRGRRVQSAVTDLPAWMDWEVHRTTADGTKPLGGLVRLAYRAGRSKRLRPERLWVVGESESREILAMHFDCTSSGSRYGIRPFDQGLNVPALQSGVAYESSMVADDVEHRISPSPQNDIEKALPSDIGENRDAWSKVEPRIYQAIEGQIIRADLKLHQLSVIPGPDCSAAHAELIAFNRGLLRNMVKRRPPAPVFLKIDHLGNGVWYLRSTDDPRLPGVRRQGAPRLECLVSAGEPVKAADRPTWLEKGRRIPEGPIIPDTKWRAELANGAVVEFLGICESPSEGKEWWGPDGSVIGYVPCLSDESPSHGTNDGKVLEFAWRIQPPANFRSLFPHVSFEDGCTSDDRRPRDRYGVPLLYIHLHRHVFEKSQEKANLILGANVDNQGVRCVKFRNISLVPGRDFGFEIEVVE